MLEVTGFRVVLGFRWTGGVGCMHITRLAAGHRSNPKLSSHQSDVFVPRSWAMALSASSCMNGWHHGREQYLKQLQHSQQSNNRVLGVGSALSIGGVATLRMATGPR